MDDILGTHRGVAETQAYRRRAVEQWQHVLREAHPDASGIGSPPQVDRKAKAQLECQRVQGAPNGTRPVFAAW